MNIAILIGRAGSKGYPNKNIKTINGIKLCEYPLIAATKSKSIDEIFVSTDCPVIKKIAKKYNCNLIVRPKRLSTSKALGDHVFEHAYFEAKKKLKKKISYISLIFANAPLLTAELIDKAIMKLKKNRNADSVVSTSIYNMWSPLRARKKNKYGYLEPFVPFETFGDPKTLNCDRDSQGNVYFADMTLSVVRPHCLEKLKDGLLPQKWMGQKILPIECEGGLDVDYEWQIPQIKFLLDKNGKKKSK